MTQNNELGAELTGTTEDLVGRPPSCLRPKFQADALCARPKPQPPQTPFRPLRTLFEHRAELHDVAGYLRAHHPQHLDARTMLLREATGKVERAIGRLGAVVPDEDAFEHDR